MISPSLAYPDPDPRLMTEFALASDGCLYIAFRDVLPKDIRRRPVFVGYALHALEVALLGSKNLLMWALTENLALGSDGRVYVNADAVQYTADRPMFRGYKASPAEIVEIVEHFHAMSFNLMCGLHGH